MLYMCVCMYTRIYIICIYTSLFSLSLLISPRNSEGGFSLSIIPGVLLMLQLHSCAHVLICLKLWQNTAAKSAIMSQALHNSSRPGLSRPTYKL